MTKKTNILIVGYRKFSQMLHSILPEFERDACFKIVDYVLDRPVDITSVIERNNADVVVSAGVNAAYLQSTLSIPVVGMEVSALDVVEAVLKAKALSERILSIHYQSEHEIIGLIQPLVGVDIYQKC